MAKNTKIDLSKSEKLYEGKRFNIYQVDVEGKQNQILKRDMVDHPGAVAIIPILDAERLILIRNHRYAISKELWELPAGTLEPNEEPHFTASRELIEETGYEAKEIIPLTHFYASPGFCNEILYIFLANQLTYVGQKLEENERIIVEEVTFKKAYEMIQKGTIEDAKTIAGLLFYKNFHQK